MTWYKGGKVKMNGFEKRERAGKDYWDDDRWKEVRKLREAGLDSRANGLVEVIRNDWNVD